MTDELPLIERDAVRLVVLDADGRVLLLNTRDLGNPEFGTVWELPGGGMDVGESYVEAAIREFREETGIDLRSDQIGKPTWRRDVSYPYRGMRRLQHEVIVAVHLRETAPQIEGSQRRDFETEDLFGSRWWTMHEISNSDETFYPRHLRTLLPRFLAGDEIAEPLELWP